MESRPNLEKFGREKKFSGIRGKRIALRRGSVRYWGGLKVAESSHFAANQKKGNGKKANFCKNVIIKEKTQKLLCEGRKKIQWGGGGGGRG